jgi:hypothetical protein
VLLALCVTWFETLVGQAVTEERLWIGVGGLRGGFKGAAWYGTCTDTQNLKLPFPPHAML